MALPTTNLTITMVRDAIGESTTQLSVLCNSYKNNWWGFTTRGATINWGVPTNAPYSLGDYRSYSHYHRAYSLVGVTQGGVTQDGVLIPPLETEMGWHVGLKFKVQQEWFPSWSTIGTSFPLYRVEFKRTSDFHKEGFVILDDWVEGNSVDYGDRFSGTLTIDCRYPEDNSSEPLTPGDTVYVRVKPLSTAYIYDKKQQNPLLGEDVIGNNEVDGYVFPLIVPDKPIIGYGAGVETTQILASESNYTVFVSADFKLSKYIDNVAQSGFSETGLITVKMWAEDSTGLTGNEDSQQFTIAEAPVGRLFEFSFAKNTNTQAGDSITVHIQSTYFNVATGYEHTEQGILTTRSVVIS